MKLWSSTTSPYVRKVRAAAIHHGLENRIEPVTVKSSFAAESAHNQDNPLGRIPVLQLDNGEWLFNSNVIAEYLDSVGQGAPLYPQDASRWQVLNLHALAEGLLENTVAMIAEKMLRPENEWWTARHEQIKQRNARTVPVLAEHLQPFGTQLNIGTLFAVCAVDFLLFRDNLTAAAGLAGVSELKAWADEMNALHPCLAATKPRVSA